MKYFFLILILAAFNSCKNCGNGPVYLDASAAYWVTKLGSGEDSLFCDNQKLVITRTNSEGKYCVGGDECCTQNPTVELDFTATYFPYFKSEPVIHIKAYQNEVEITGGKAGYVAGIRGDNIGDNGKNTCTEKDTTIDSTTYKMLILDLSYTDGDPIKIPSSASYIRDLGIISYTDRYNRIWKRR